MVKLSELQMKEIIVVNTGRRLGHLSDLEIDPHRGKIESIIINIKENNSLFGRQEEILIPWNQIITIGTDVILVEKFEEPALYPEEN